MKYIFEEIIKTEDLFMKVEQHFEVESEREHMLNLIRNTLHHQLVDLVLDELNHDQRLEFLIEIENEEKHPSLLERLREWIENFEEKLHLRTKEAEVEMLGLFEGE